MNLKRHGDPVIYSAHAEIQHLLSFTRTGYSKIVCLTFTVSAYFIGSSYSDKGRYTCVATNTVGTIRRDQELDVLVTPTIDSSRDEVVDILKGERLTLSCMVDGNPTPVVR